jgi:hypothetical protein
MVIALAVLTGVGDVRADEEILKIAGVIYNKFLWGNQRFDGSLYNFTTVPGEGFGDNGQGAEFELFLSGRVSRHVTISGRLKARFNQNQWTNFGGFGGRGAWLDAVNNNGDCVGGDCGEFDSRSAQYIKLRGTTVNITPGYDWLNTVVVGSSDFGMFDPFVIGKLRYIDRDNTGGLLFQGSMSEGMLSYDVTRISLPRLWAGPNFQTGEYTAADAAYGLQLGLSPDPRFDVALIGEYVNDIEISSNDIDLDDGRNIRTRFKNRVGGVRVEVSPDPRFEISARGYFSDADSESDLDAPESFGLAGFSPVPAGRLGDESYRLNVEVNDPFENGLSFSVEGFDIGSEYVSMMAARRESDVLLTEGHDGAFAFPGPSNAAFGVFSGNPTRIGFGGWEGNAQQVATINVDNEFTDFEEPMAETAIGWRGFTLVPTWGHDDLNVSGEYTYIDYSTNWQAWGDPTRAIDDTPYPTHELDTGVGHNFRSAYAPFQDKKTQIGVVKADYLLDVGTGVEIFGKFKIIDEEDDRMTDPRFLPYVDGDCPGGGVACGNQVNNYFDQAGDTFSTSSIYGNPSVITVDGVTDYQWKPFDDVTDDDRDLDYTMFQVGGGYQLTNELYGSLAYERYDAELMDGNTAFQAYQLHEMASGDHEKNKLILKTRYSLTGTEFGLIYEYNWGTFTPDFGDGYVPQIADDAISQDHNVPVDSMGFSGRFGGWNSLEERDFTHNRLKAYLKVQI